MMKFVDGAVALIMTEEQDLFFADGRILHPCPSVDLLNETIELRKYCNRICGKARVTCITPQAGQYRIEFITTGVVLFDGENMIDIFNRMSKKSCCTP